MSEENNYKQLITGHIEQYLQEIDNVFKFNELCGNGFGVTTLKDNNLYSLYENLIGEELLELFLAQLAHNRQETIDAFGDIFYVTVGALYSLGIDKHQVMQLILQGSNSEDINLLHEGVLGCKSIVLKIGLIAEMIVTAIKATGDDDLFLAIVDNVTKGNYSKFCTSEEDAIKSVESYAVDNRYKDVYYELVGDLYVIKGFKVDSEEGDAPKILKGVNFEEPTHDNIIQMIDEGVKKQQEMDLNK